MSIKICRHIGPFDFDPKNSKTRPSLIVCEAYREVITAALHLELNIMRDAEDTSRPEVETALREIIHDLGESVKDREAERRYHQEYDRARRAKAV